LNLIWVRDCPEAHQSLLKEIQEAKKELKEKKISVQ
jgi:hypothetical protein